MMAQGLAAQVITWFVLTAGIAISVALTLSWFLPTAAGNVSLLVLLYYYRLCSSENHTFPTAGCRLLFIGFSLSRSASED